MKKMRDELDQAMRNVVLPDERRRAILNGKTKKAASVKPVRIAAAALCAALAVSIAALASSDLRAALLNALGGLAGQSQTVTGVSTESEGIEIRVVSALSDSNYTKIYCEVRDKTGDRLGPEMDLAGGIALPASDAKMWSAGQKVIDYNEDTRTALIELTRSNCNLTGDSQASVWFSSFQAIREVEGIPLPDGILTAETRRMIELEDGGRALAPEQTPHALEGSDLVRLSSFGFGEDGRLHLQFAFAGSANHAQSQVLTTVRSRTGKDDFLYNQDLTSLSFEREGTYYYDFACSAAPADLDDLAFDTLWGRLYVKPPVEGEWKLDVTVQIPEQLTYETHTQVGGTVVTQVKVSPISVFVVSDNDASILFGRRPTYAMLRDGTKVILTGNNVSASYTAGEFNGDSVGHSYDQWMFDKPIDPADLVSINLDGVTVPLQE